MDIGTDAAHATPQFDDDTNTGVNGGYRRALHDRRFCGRQPRSSAGTLGGKNFVEGCTDSVAP